MGGIALKRRLSDMVTSLQAEGMLDGQFDQLREIHDDDNPFFMMNVLETFCQKADDDIRDIARYLSDETIDHATVTVVAHRIKGSSQCIGACRIASVCRDLRDCSDDNNKPGCYEAYERLITEYYALREKLNNIVQLQKSILQSEGRKRR